MDGDDDQGTDVGGAADQIAALLKGSSGDGGGAEAGGGDGGQGPQAAAGGQDDDDGQAGGGDDQEGAGEGGEGEGAGDGDGDAGTGGDAAAELVDHEFEGKTYKLPKAIAEAAMRQADYTRKTETLARDREFVAARSKALDVEQRMLVELAPYEMQMQNLRQQIGNLSGDRPDPLTDPIGYLQRGKQIDDLKGALEHLQASVTERRTALTAQKQSADAEIQGEFLKTLAREIPNWGEQANVEITRQLLSEGFTPQQVADLRDPIVVKMAHKLAQLSKREQARATARTKVAGTSTPTVRPTGSGNRAGTSRTGVDAAKNRAKATGNMRDAGAAILAVMRGRRPG